MKTIKFRDLKPDEIEVRVGTVEKDSGFSLLLYKTARVDANILDETVGAFNWQKKFYQVKNTMICSLGINVNYADEAKEPYWVWKDDAGDESNMEAIKGEASDSFKRAGFAFSIGRKLYTAPFIWIKQDDFNNKYTKYEVKEIEYNDDSITKLVIINKKTKETVFAHGINIKIFKGGVSSENKSTLSSDLIKELKDLGVSLEQVAIYCKTKVEKLTDAELQFAIKAIKQKRGKQ